MVWAPFEVKERERSFLPPSQQPVLSPPPPIEIQPEGFNLDSKINPSILLTIIILSIIFFFSGLLHLLLRFLMKPQHREVSEEPENNSSAFQGQLQQLFHLHDEGVDQSFIDSLPVFFYKTIIGLKDPFDCAVCLCEFESEDKLRLLTTCSHAFHMDCIDTWLLTHSTCPLCRASLLSDFPSNSPFPSPIVVVLESASSSSRENGAETENYLNSQVVCSSSIDTARKSSEIVKGDETSAVSTVVPIKLGKFKTLGEKGESSSNSDIDSRRCFSMGSFGYIMDANSSLRVPIRTPMKKPPRKKPRLPLAPGSRSAMSECDCESRRDFKFSATDSFREGNGEKNGISISDSSRRAFSFHFPANWERPRSENGVGIGENLGSEFDEENQRRNSLDIVANRPSLVRRTLLWITGRQSRVVHSSVTPNF